MVSAHTSALNKESIPLRQWRFLDAQLVWIYQGTPQTDGHIEACDPHYILWKLLKGSVRIESGDHVIRARAGQWVFLSPSQNKRYFSEDAQILSLHFEANWATGRQLFNFTKPVRIESPKTSQWMPPLNEMLKLVRRRFPNAYYNMPWMEAECEVYAQLQGSFYRWLARAWPLLRQECGSVFVPQMEDDRAMEMRRWIEAQPVGQPFRLETMAVQFGLSPSQINRLFVSRLGLTPKRYMEKRRLSYAVAALESSSAMIKEIAYGVGFRHPSEFTSWFKRHTGKTPLGFRREPS